MISRYHRPRHKLGSRFGANPELPRLIVCTLHKALFGRNTCHPDSKRQQRAKMEARYRSQRKEITTDEQ